MSYIDLMARFCILENSDGNTYEWIEYLCPDTLKIVDRKVIGFNGNQIKDQHQMHTTTEGVSSNTMKYTPFRHRRDGGNYI